MFQYRCLRSIALIVRMNFIYTDEFGGRALDRRTQPIRQALDLNRLKWLGRVRLPDDRPPRFTLFSEANHGYRSDPGG